MLPMASTRTPNPVLLEFSIEPLDLASAMIKMRLSGLFQLREVTSHSDSIEASLEELEPGTRQATQGGSEAGMPEGAAHSSNRSK